MALNIKLEVFEGPLDLLLHLIDKNKVDIYDIPIVEITDQYMEYVNQMKTESLDVMSEFLVMAATLLDIKSKMLLPKEVDEEGEEEDPRADLVQKLLEYKMYKMMSVELRDMQFDAQQSFFKSPTLPKEIANYRPPIDYEQLIGDMNLGKLHGLFKEMIRRQEDRIDPIRSKFGKVEKDEINLDEKTIYIQEYIRSHRQFSFRKLLEKQHSKMEIIVTFLVILEMMKTGEIGIVQENIFDDIIITSKIAS